MRLAALIAVAFLVSSVPAAAQTAPVPGTCTLGTAAAVLDIGDVSARVFNTGSLFYGNGFADAYVVPSRTGRSQIYHASVIVGGRVAGERRASGALFEGFVFRPGPLGPDARPVDPDDCSPYDRIYTVSRLDIARYNGTGVATDDLRDWPWQLGAPVLDGDGDPDNYDLAAGDQPAIRGDQTAWWLMNDAGTPETGIPGVEHVPLGLEVRAEAVAFTQSILSQSTLYRYTLTNRSAATIDSAYVGLFMDADLGNAGNDRSATDTTFSVAYMYDTEHDGEGEPFAGPPPSIGIQVLDGPVGLPNGRDDDGDGAADEPGERLRLTAAPYMCKNAEAACSDSNVPGELYRRLQGDFGDGTVMRELGRGIGQPADAPRTRFVYTGDPVTGAFWSELNPGPGMPMLPAGDKRVMAATGPFRLEPGASETVTFAIPFGQGADNLDSIMRLRQVATSLRAAFDAGYLEPQRVDGFLTATPDETVRLSRPAPNPFTERAVVRYAMPAGTRMRATLHDVRGRQVAVLFDGATVAPEGEIVIDGSGLAAGVYRLRVTVPRGERFLTLVHTR